MALLASVPAVSVNWFSPLGFLGPFTISLPLITFMGLLTIIPAMPNHWVFYFIPWTSSTRLLLLYLSLFPWTYHFIHWASSAHLLLFYLLLLSYSYWLSILPHQPTGPVTSFFYYFSTHFLLISLIVGLLLLLGLVSKLGINKLQGFFEHSNGFHKSCDVGSLMGAVLCWDKDLPLYHFGVVTFPFGLEHDPWHPNWRWHLAYGDYDQEGGKPNPKHAPSQEK